MAAIRPLLIPIAAVCYISSAILAFVVVNDEENNTLDMSSEKRVAQFLVER